MESHDRRTVLGALALLILTPLLAGPGPWLRVLWAGAGRPRGRRAPPPVPVKVRPEPPVHSVARHA